MTDDLRTACAREIHVMTKDGDLLKGGAAVMFIFDGVGYRALAWTGRRPGISWCVNLGYQVVARNRRFFSKFMFTKE